MSMRRAIQTSSCRCMWSRKRCSACSRADRPKMLSIGMHCRILGRPARLHALQRFLDHVQRHEDVWIARRIDIARHWMQVHPAPAS